ncbi:E3 ubiquitin-protein ligase rnf8-like [Babylonia areolata]|uniref:E3 ubiquitin-protein ligase rnf8-like n=1 Tax=Babylonia areolata TaxID=304850 RepID=UPI003FD158D0
MIMTEAHPCLLSIGKTSSKYRHFPFLEDQVKIGRAAEATYTILSTTISRCHAVINRKDDRTWTITDNKSLNGISVNGKKLQALEPCTLQDGDIVQLGVPASPEVPPEFVYRFFSSLKVRKEPGGKKRPSSGDGGQSKRHKGTAESEETSTQSDHSAGREEKENSQEDAEAKREQERLKSQYEEQLRILAQQLKEKEEEKWAITQQLQQEREERQVIEEKQKEQEERVNELDSKQKQLAMEKAAAEEQMRQQMEEQLRAREEMLRSQMQQRLDLLAVEKSQVEERLQREKEKAVQEKDKELQDRLQGERDRLQQIIENKELEQKALESQLAESRVENERARADTLLTKESILSEFAETMETELQCAICNELFVKATSLNCSHAFCSLCLRQWLAVKKECPNCRTTVTSQMRSIVLDNYIDRMVEQLSIEMKERRTLLVAERKEAEKKLDEAENKAKAGPSGAAARGRRNHARGAGRGRRGRVRGVGRGGRAISAPHAPATAVRAPAIPVPAPAPAVAQAPAVGATDVPTASATTTTTTTAASADAAAAATETTVPSVGATITIGSPDESVDGAVVDYAAAAAPILISDVDSDSDNDSMGGMSDELERILYGHNILEDDDDDFGSGHTNSEEEEDNDGDYVRGTGAYYGGYGRCFKCGARGHWANGCPYR